MNKILVSGISGFVGTNLVTALKQQYAIYGVDIHFPDYEGVTAIFGWDELEKIPSVNAIVHLAGIAHDTRNTINPQAYFDINVGLTKKMFDYFLRADAEKFIFFSSVKAVADTVPGNSLTEEVEPNPKTAYGKSKLEAERYILSKPLSNNKKVYILRPCMIHGPGNKGNLNLLYRFIRYGIPYPLAAFQNKRSLLSIGNLCFVIREILENVLPSGVYNISDDEPLSTEEIIRIIGIAAGRKIRIWKLPKKLIQYAARIGDILHLPLNSERLTKLTENYVVSNEKLIKALNKQLPVSAKDGLFKTIKSFESN